MNGDTASDSDEHVDGSDEDGRTLASRFTSFIIRKMFFLGTVEQAHSIGSFVQNSAPFVGANEAIKTAKTGRKLSRN